MGSFTLLYVWLSTLYSPVQLRRGYGSVYLLYVWLSTLYSPVQLATGD